MEWLDPDFYMCTSVLLVSKLPRLPFHRSEYENTNIPIAHLLINEKQSFEQMKADKPEKNENQCLC